jgi:CzcA family heavy metal efflux pump
MMRSIVTLVMRYRVQVLAIAAVMMLYGISQLRHMPVDVLPEFSLPYVEIQTEALGLSAEDVEQLITLGMEQDLLNGVPWVQTIRSESVPGLSSIVIVFKPGTDLMRARQMVSERLTQAYVLPHVSKPPIMLQPLSATSRFMIVGLSSKSLSPIQMSVLARWTIVPRLKGVPGVANVATWGQRDRQLQVRVDPKRLQHHNVSLLRVLETTGNALWYSTLSFVEASTPGSGGFIDTRNQRLGVRHVSPIVSPQGLAQMPIEGTALHLGDVADVVEDHQPLIGDALTRDGPGLLLVIEKFPGSNTLDVTRNVEGALAELLPGLPGMDVNTRVFRQADFIEMAIHHLALVALIGLVLLVGILAAFFVDWRTTLISVVTILLSIMAAGLVLYLTGATINAVVLTGLAIAIGIVVYDAIIDVENVTRRLRESPKEGRPESTTQIILEASLESRSAVVYATVILLLAVLPTFWIGGVSGAFFQPLAMSYGLAVLASMVVALTVTPALCVMLLAGAPVERRASPLVGWLQRVYGPVLARILPRGRLALAAVGVLTVIGLLVLPSLNRSLLPAFKERNLVIHLRSLPGTSQPEMTRISGRISRELQSLPGVGDVAAHIGRAVLGDQPVDVHSAELWVSIDASANYDQTAAAIQGVVDGYPGVKHRVQTYLGGISEDVVAESEDQIVARIYGETEDGLRRRAKDVRKAIGGITGIVESHIDLPVQQAALEVQVDIAAAQRHGLKPGDVRRAAATLMSGIVVGNLYEEQKVFEVVVWSTPATRHSLSSVRDLMIDTPGGGRVRLGEVAQVRIVPASSVIRHDAVKRYIDVIADVEGRDLAAVAAEVKSRLQQVQFPLEYHAEVLGDYALHQATLSRLLTIAMAAAIGVFLVLQAAFGSWRLAALSFLTLPAALVGGLLATRVTGGVLSLGSLAGLLAVFGIAVCNKIMLLTRYQHLERYEGEPFGPGLVLRGARERLAPILMTTLAAGVAVGPALFFGDAPGLELVRPMAITTLGGLVTSGLLDLLVLPALFMSFGVRSVRDLDPVIGDPAGPIFGAMPAAPALARD